MIPPGDKKSDGEEKSLYDLLQAQLELLPGRVSKKTIAHSLQTAQFMTTFMDQAGISREQAVMAGLLHDVMKDAEKPALLDAAAEYGIPVSDIQRRNPVLLHGPIAAETCRRNLGVTDRDVLDAIHWHTTGRPYWSNVGLALFLADYVEPTRTFPEAITARRILETEGFWPALKYATDEKLAHIQKKQRDFDPATIEFQQWLHSELKA